MFSRRDFAKLALAGVPASLALAKINSTVKGVMIGAQTYSFRDRPVDQAIEGMKQVGLGYAEVWSGHIEPKTGRSKEGREQLRVAKAEIGLRGERERPSDALALALGRIQKLRRFDDQARVDDLVADPDREASGVVELGERVVELRLSILIEPDN